MSNGNSKLLAARADVRDLEELLAALAEDGDGSPSEQADEAERDLAKARRALSALEAQAEDAGR